MKDHKNKPRPSRIGRRTKTDILQGKVIRSQEDGTDVFEDYWTDGESSHSNQTTLSVVSPNSKSSNQTSTTGTILDVGDLAPAKSLRSSLKKTLNISSEEYNDDVGVSHTNYSRRSVVSKEKSLYVSRNLRNATITDTKLTQTSLTLGVTERSPSKNRPPLGEIDPKNDPLYNRENISSKTNSPRDSLDNLSSDSQNEMRNVKSSKQHISVASVSLSPEAESKKKTRKSSYKIVENKSSPFRNETSAKRSHLGVTQRNISVSSDSEDSSNQEISPKVLSDHPQSPNSAENVSQRNSSIHRSPQLVANSSEFLHLNKDTPKRNESLNRSAVKLFHPREMEGIQKSSSIKFKRKSQAPSASESVLSKVRNVQNWDNDIHKGDFSGATSFQHVDKSPDLLENRKSGKESKEKNSSRSAHLLTKSGIITGLRETRRKLTDYSDSEESSNEGRSSRALSQSPNRDEEDNQKNSSALRSPRPVAKSSKILKRNENISSIIDKSLDKSCKQKSSLGNSLITSKRKSQTTNALEERPTKTVPVRNRKGDSRNFSELTSFQNVAKSSDLLNQKEIEPGKKSEGKINSGAEESLSNCEINGDFREIEREITDSPAIEKRSRISSDSQSPSSNVKDDHRNSVERHSLLSTRFSELQNQKDISSMSSKSLNSSKMSASPQKENEVKLKIKRKSFLKKSAKKKTLAPNASENILSTTASVQNQDKGNFSGVSYSEPAAKSPEVQNGKEFLLSNSGKNINGTEGVDFREKQQSSANEMSPRTSQSGMIDILSSKESLRKTISPRRKIDFSEKKKSVRKDKKNSPTDVRRSSRTRFPPLASWRNERPKYVLSSSGEMKFVGLDKGQPEDDFGLRVLERKKKEYELRAAQKKPRKEKKVKKTISATKITNGNTGEELQLYLHRPFTTNEWTMPANDESPGYMISQVFSSKLITFGFVDIAGHSVKEPRFSPTDNAQFVLVKGVVEVEINTTSFTFQKGDSFIVPAGTMYSIKNNSSSNALLHFCAFKIPFFKYQNV